jgi:hypothetical protein
MKHLFFLRWKRVLQLRIKVEQLKDADEKQKLEIAEALQKVSISQQLSQHSYDLS